MVTPRKNTDERRAEIADVALRLIGSRGLAALTVASLSQALGITGGALYRHYASLDEILTAMAARAAQLIDASTPAEELPPRAWLLAFAEQRTATVGGHAGLSQLLLSEQLTLGLPAEAVAHVAAAVTRTRGAILRKLRDGQELGIFRFDIAAPLLVPIVIGTIQIIALQRAGSVLPRAPGNAMASFEALLALLTPPEPIARARPPQTARNRRKS